MEKIELHNSSTLVGEQIVVITLANLKNYSDPNLCMYAHTRYLSIKGLHECYVI